MLDGRDGVTGREGELGIMMKNCMYVCMHGMDNSTECLSHCYYCWFKTR